MKTIKSTLKVALAAGALGCIVWTAGAQYQPSSASQSPDLQEVVKLSQAHMPDDVIRNYVVSTGKSYRLSADDILYLNNQGVSASVISALQTTDSGNSYTSAPTVPAPPPVTQNQPAPLPPPGQSSVNAAPTPVAYAPPTVVDTTPPPPPEVSFQYFHDQLAPYGTWVNIGGVMYWRPDQAVALDPDWRPYYDMGQWVETEDGLYWQSDYTWGDIPFHYGRWILNPSMGWLWAPDYTWGPAWVFWRQDEVDSCIGWAPLPVGAVFVNNGFFFNGVSVNLDFDFGLGESCFTFVSYEHFHEPFFRIRGHEWEHNFDRHQIHGFYSHSVVRNEFRHDEHGRFVNNGIGHDRIERLTHVQHANFEERRPVGDRNHLATTHADDSHAKKPGTGDQWHGQAANSGNAHVNQGPAHGNSSSDRTVKTGGTLTSHDPALNNGQPVKTGVENSSQHNQTVNNDRGAKTGTPYGQTLGTQQTGKTGGNLIQHDQSFATERAVKTGGPTATIHEQPAGNGRPFNADGGNANQYQHTQPVNNGQNLTQHNPPVVNDRAMSAAPSAPAEKVFLPPSPGGDGGGAVQPRQPQTQQSQPSQESHQQQQHDKKK